MSTNLRRVPSDSTHSRKPFVQVSSAYRRDHAVKAAGVAYTLAQTISQMTDADLGKAVHEDRSTRNRKRNGVAPSSKSRSREEILRIGAAGGNPWPLVADDIAAAIQGHVAPLSTAELRLLRRSLTHREQRANGRLDVVQMASLDDQAVCQTEARTAKLEQAAWTLLLLAIHDELAVRRDP